MSRSYTPMPRLPATSRGPVPFAVPSRDAEPSTCPSLGMASADDCRPSAPLVLVRYGVGLGAVAYGCGVTRFELVSRWLARRLFGASGCTLLMSRGELRSPVFGRRWLGRTCAGVGLSTKGEEPS